MLSFMTWSRFTYELYACKGQLISEHNFPDMSCPKKPTKFFHTTGIGWKLICGVKFMLSKKATIIYENIPVTSKENNFVKTFLRKINFTEVYFKYDTNVWNCFFIWFIWQVLVTEKTYDLRIIDFYILPFSSSLHTCSGLRSYMLQLWQNINEIDDF